MSNGYLKQNENNEWQGKIETLRHNMRIKMVPVKNRTENSPAFEVHTPNNGGSLKIGVAFEKHTKEGEVFYSMSLDDPSFDAPLYVTAFQSRDHDGFDIVWQRPRKKEAA